MTALANLVAAAQAGDKQAFGELVVRFQDMAYATAYAILGDVYLAQDAAQEAFLDAYQNLTNLREPAAFPGWFRRIVLGRSHRQIRTKPAAQLSLDALLDRHMGLRGTIYDEDEQGRGITTDFRDPRDVVAQVETAQEVQAAIATLAPNHRLAIALYYVEGYSQKEIATYLEVPVSTVKKRLFDARRYLKERIVQMVQAQLRNTRPSQNADFARRIQFFTATLAGDVAQMEQLIHQDRELLTAVVEWKMALKSGYWPLGSTALHLVAGRDDAAAATMLLGLGAPIEAKNVGDITPLHVAAIMQRPKMAQLLLEQGANVNARSKFDQSALHHAALRGDDATLRVLLAHKADVTLRDVVGHTAAELAARHAHPSSVDLLVAHGATKPTVSLPTVRAARRPDDTLLATGIKAIDLLAPLPRGGIAGHFTPLAGVGFSVVLAHYLIAIGTLYDGHGIYVGLESYDGYGESLRVGWQEMDANKYVSYAFGRIEDNTDQRQQLLAQAIADAQAQRDAGQETLLLIDSNLATTPGVLPMLHASRSVKGGAAITTIIHGHHTVGVMPAPLSELDTLITFSGPLARQRLYPAIDPVRSTSSLLTEQKASAEHLQTANEVRRLLHRYMDVAPVVDAGGVDALWYIDDDPTLYETITRARRVQRFLTQPFYGTEPWTGSLGQFVPLAETLRGCQAILAGDYDETPEEVLYFIGTIDEAGTQPKVAPV